MSAPQYDVLIRCGRVILVNGELVIESGTPSSAGAGQVLARS